MKVIPAKAQWTLGSCLVCDAFRELRRISVTGNRHGIERTAKHCELLSRKHHISCTNVFSEPCGLRRTGNGSDEITLSENPSEGNLRGRCTVNLGGLTNQIHNAFIGFQIFRLKARNNAAEIVSTVGRIGMNRSREEALAERAERHETDALRF